MMRETFLLPKKMHPAMSLCHLPVFMRLIHFVLYGLLCGPCQTLYCHSCLMIWCGVPFQMINLGFSTTKLLTSFPTNNYFKWEKTSK